MNTVAPFKFAPVPRRLVGKRALVTGAGTGIGRSAAIRLAQEGARVGLIGRRADKLEETAGVIGAERGECLVLPTDVSKEDQVEKAVAAVVGAWGGLDVLVAVAGIELWRQGDDKVDRLSLEVWQQIIDINLTGMFLSCKHSVRAMLTGGQGGSVVITGSPTGLYGLALGEHAYSASKGGCHGLVRVMASEYAANGIRVNCVVPGFIDTAVNAPVFEDPQALHDFCQTIPQRRAGHPDELAGIYAWLASDDASYTTGAFFVIDGGKTAI
jgi:NAD(P)-dependent dehydrogenase (short-subunit alcohol dehydrogenase family)